MKAIIRSKYGAPQMLQMADVPKPLPKQEQVLIKVIAASINAYDDRILRGNPFLVRLSEGLLSPKNKIMGADVSGVVEAVGKGVTMLKAGDEVYGCLADGGGGAGFAEYVCGNQSTFAHKPQGISFAQAAALPMAGVTALQGIRELGQLQPGQRVLINGASGGVGGFAVQIAKALGANVSGVCSPKNIDMVRSLGAQEVIDYTQADFTQGNVHYDLIVDIAANHTLKEYRRVLQPDGKCVVIGFSGFSHMLSVMLWGAAGEKKVRLLMADNTQKADLEALNQLVEAGQLRPVIDQVYPLEQARQAFEYFEQEHARGKVVLQVAQ